MVAQQEPQPDRGRDEDCCYTFHDRPSLRGMVKPPRSEGEILIVDAVARHAERAGGGDQVFMKPPGPQT